MVAEEVGYLLVAGYESAEGCERFGECAHYEVNVVGNAEVVACAAAPFAEYADAVGFVDHHCGIVFLCQAHNFGEVGHIALH